MYACPECESEINQASEVCPYCNADLTAPRQAAGGPEKKSSLTKRLALWVIALGMLWGIAWLAVPWRMADSKSAAEVKARDALASLQSALAAYQASERTFPDSLEPLGDRARQAAQAAQSVHYSLQYAPAPPDSDGRVKSYTLLARAGNFGYLNFYTDETGVVHATVEDRPATSNDRALKPSS